MRARLAGPVPHIPQCSTQHSILRLTCEIRGLESVTADGTPFLVKRPHARDGVKREAFTADPREQWGMRRQPLPAAI